MSTTAAIVLAAGTSSRLGKPKQLIDWNGRPLLEDVVAAVLDWPIDATIVVLGAHADEILEVVDFGSAVVAVNDGWAEGMASSLRVGFDLLTHDAQYERAFVVLGDQPRIPVDIPPGLLAAAEETTRPAVVPVYRYERGNPVLFDRSIWTRLMTLEGDSGAASLLQTHPEWVEEVRFDHLRPRDIDTPDDVADLLGGGRSGG